MAGTDSPLGEFIRRQRELQDLSMRRLADLVGISNPYLSQIEHGLREPSERVLEALADNLELSADVLRERTRRAQDEDEDEPPVVMAIKADRNLSARQRRIEPRIIQRNLQHLGLRAQPFHRLCIATLSHNHNRACGHRSSLRSH